MRRASLICTILALWTATVAEAARYRFVTLVFPPLEYEAKDGTATGAAVDVVRDVMTALGHEVEIRVLPWARAIRAVEEGRADAIFTAYRTPERESFLDFGAEVLVPQVVALYVRRGSSLGFKGDFKELAGAKIGTLSTISYGTAFDEARERYGLRTDRVESLDLNFKKLAAGRLDYVISNRYSAQVEIDALGLEDRIMELPLPVAVTPSYIAFSKKKNLTKLRDAFDKELRRMKKAGGYYAVMDKYKVRMPRPQ